jgi:glycerol-3-phosphate dehydrogenase (NAD(P)+)
MKEEKKIAVIGGGSWATALVKILCNNLNSVNWWMRSDGAVAHILKYRHNPNYLQSVEFDLNKINVSTDLEEIIRPADIVIIATPSAFLVSIFEHFPKALLRDKVVFSAVKGIVPQHNTIPAHFIHFRHLIDR